MYSGGGGGGGCTRIADVRLSGYTHLLKEKQAAPHLNTPLSVDRHQFNALDGDVRCHQRDRRVSPNTMHGPPSAACTM